MLNEHLTQEFRIEIHKRVVLGTSKNCPRGLSNSTEFSNTEQWSCLLFEF